MRKKMTSAQRAKVNSKRDYKKEYQRDQKKRLSYRSKLNQARRERGIYGKGGPDVSHTEGGKLTLEDPSTNRARNGKNGKTTLRSAMRKKKR